MHTLEGNRVDMFLRYPKLSLLNGKQKDLSILSSFPFGKMIIMVPSNSYYKVPMPLAFVMIVSSNRQHNCQGLKCKKIV